MALPAPSLDDRRFQDLVDDAKRLVMQRCPEWTDHNVSDPGVTLIETFAFMTDQLLYRLNRVPDRLYVRFLDLIGVRLLPPTPARTSVTFWLTAPAEQPLTIRAGTKTATMRTETDDAVEFATVDDLAIVPCSLACLATEAAGSDERTYRLDDLALGVAFPAFSAVPGVGDAVLIGLSEPVPSNAVMLRFRASIEGVGVDPTDPPLAWEAWNGGSWSPCEVDHDDTGGLNQDGEVVVHVPGDHAAGVFDGTRAGWLRMRVVDQGDDRPRYSSSPTVHGLLAATVGGSVDSIHAEVVEDEVLGVSEGVTGQRFRVARTPVLAGAAPPLLEVSGDDGWEEWTEVQGFATSGPDDRHFLLDAVPGEVVFGPAVREPDGSLRAYGAAPPRGAYVRMRRYVTGGGRTGCVAKGAVRTLRSAIPFIAGVSNRSAASGGVDGEDLESAKARGPIALRTRSRAVTAEDFEWLAREAAPEVARVRCVPAGGDDGDDGDAGAVRVLVVPSAPSERGRIRFEDLLPTPETLERVAARLEQARLLGTRVLVEPPRYQGVTVVARLSASPRASATRIRDEALERLDTYLNPLTGGPDGEGWPWQRPVQSGEVFALLQSIKGVDLVEDVRLFGANPITGERGQPTQRLELEPHGLVFSYAHQLRVEQA